jgi:hypothetical protein
MKRPVCLIQTGHQQEPRANKSLSALLNVVTGGNLPLKMLDEIKFRLAHFVDFNGGSNHVADDYIKWDLGIRYAWFDMRGFPGVPSWLLNGNPVPVQIWCNPAGMVFGDTADGHMLIGQRRRSVTETSDSALIVITEAYEWPRGIFNWLGMRLMKKSKRPIYQLLCRRRRYREQTDSAFG